MPSSTSDPAQRPLVALTGATGFIGRRLVPALAQAGWQVRLLMRRDPVISEWRSLRPQVVAGDLHDEAGLERLVEGAQAVIHVAGLIKAARREHFLATNRDGAARLARVAARIAPESRFLHVSTLAAREPALSDYAESKRAGEDAVRELLGPRVTVVRPPAVYGPGDPETLVFFQLARQRWIPLLGSPEARAAMIHVDDLAALLATLAGEASRGAVLTPADARPAGYSWREILATAARAVGNARPRFFHAPLALLRVAALAGDVGRGFGAANMLSSQKLREIRHPDWSIPEAGLAHVPGWTPRFSLDDGFRHTVDWYRTAGWLTRG